MSAYPQASLLKSTLTELEKENGNPLQCSCLENPRDGEPGGLPSMGSHRVGHDWSDLAAAATLIERCSRAWEDPKINQVWTQNQAKQDDWPKETRKMCPIKVTQLSWGPVSLNLPVCLSTCTLFSPNKHFTCLTILCLYVEIHFYTADGPGPHHWHWSLVV